MSIKITNKINNLPKNEHFVFMKRAYEVSQKSQDPSSQMGSIIVKDNKEVAKGFNQFPKGCSNDYMTNERPMKYLLVIHAEMEALDNARRNKISIENSILYVTSSPCENCLKHAINSGVKTIIFNEFYPRFSDESKEAISRLVKSSSIEVFNMENKSILSLL